MIIRRPAPPCSIDARVPSSLVWIIVSRVIRRSGSNSTPQYSVNHRAIVRGCRQLQLCLVRGLRKQQIIGKIGFVCPSQNPLCLLHLCIFFWSLRFDTFATPPCSAKSSSCPRPKISLARVEGGVGIPVVYMPTLMVGLLYPMRVIGVLLRRGLHEAALVLLSHEAAHSRCRVRRVDRCGIMCLCLHLCLRLGIDCCCCCCCCRRIRHGLRHAHGRMVG